LKQIPYIPAPLQQAPCTVCHGLGQRVLRTPCGPASPYGPSNRHIAPSGSKLIRSGHRAIRPGPLTRSRVEITGSGAGLVHSIHALSREWAVTGLPATALCWRAAAYSPAQGWLAIHRAPAAEPVPPSGCSRRPPLLHVSACAMSRAGHPEPHPARGPSRQEAAPPLFLAWPHGLAHSFPEHTAGGSGQPARTTGSEALSPISAMRHTTMVTDGSL